MDLRSKKQSVPTGSRIPLFLADNRIQIGPKVGNLTVDYTHKTIQGPQFDTLVLLASHADSPVSREEIITEIYGWSTIDYHTLERFNKTIASCVGFIRQKLGEELGDVQYGAIRTVSIDNAMSRSGYVALSSM